MENDLIGGLAIGAATTGVNNLLSEWHADKAFARQNQLADKQFAQNMALQRASLSNQVSGAKLAGLNPAMVGQSPGSSQSVGQGSGSKGENVEVSPNDILALAQARNLDADTKLKNEQSSNTQEDTNLKVAQTLLVGANTDKVNEEYTQIKNFNEQFNAENEALSQFGSAMAEKWKSTEWYAALGSDSKRTIDAMASGEIPLSVGAMRALEQTIQAQKNLSDADRALIDNAFANVITEGMWNDSEVKKALVKLPETQQNEAKARIANYWADVGLKKIDKQWKKDNYESYKANNVDFRYKEYWKNPNLENFVKWITASSNEKLNKAYDSFTHMAPAAAGGYMAGKAMNKSQHSVTSTSNTPPIYGSDGTIVRPATSTTNTWSNTHMFK